MSAVAPVLVAEGLVYHYDEDVPALCGVDLAVADNAYLAVVGQNGSGKTTLVKHFNGLLRPTAGCVRVLGQDTRRATVTQLARQVGYVFQNPDHQIFCATVREEVAFGPRNLGLDAAAVGARVDEALAAFDLEAYAVLPPAMLGWGLRRKVTLAAVYAMRPRILVLDEPTTGLDRRSADDLMARVDALHAAGHTIVLVTHDMRLVAEHARETLVMHEGRLLAHGATREVLCRAAELARAAISVPQVTRLAQALAAEGLPGDVLTVDEFCTHYRRRLEGAP